MPFIFLLGFVNWSNFLHSLFFLVECYEVLPTNKEGKSRRRRGPAKATGTTNGVVSLGDGKLDY